MLCVCVCVCTVDIDPVMWRSGHDLGSVPWGIIPNSPRHRLSTSSLLDVSQTRGRHEQKRWRGFVFLRVTWGRSVIFISLRVILSEWGPGLYHTWMDSLHGSRTLKSVWVISCQGMGGGGIRIGLLKQFSWNGGLLSACQQPDYSIQPFFCSQSAQRAPESELHAVNTWYRHENCCSTRTVHVRLEEVYYHNTFDSKQPQNQHRKRKGSQISHNSEFTLIIFCCMNNKL